MNFNISTWAIRNPTPAILLFMLLTFSGLVSFHSMKVQDLPDLELPTVTVAISLPGASPSQLETDVVRKIESSLATIQGVKHIYSSLTDGEALISVEFRLERSTQAALDDVRDAVSRIRADLPSDLRDPVIKKREISETPILTYALGSSRLDNEALSWFVDNDVSKTLQAVKGVGAVSRVGGVNREIRVDLDFTKLLAFNTTAADISRQLQLVQQEAAGGRAHFGGMEQSVRTIATVQSAEEFATMEITLSDGRRIRLDQIATVSDTVAEQRSAAFFNGESVVGFEITRAIGYGEIDVAAGVRSALQQLQEQRPDITITEVFNLVDPVAENYAGSIQILYEGALLAVLVVFLFLRNWRATLIAAVALPLSIIPTFAVIHMMGFSLNMVTLLSLSLVIGVLVDDAIVEIENIERHLLMGKTPYQAAMEAADEIGLAVVATTFTLVAVFLPTAFMSGVIGKFFVQFGWTAAIAVLFSLLVARMLTPMMAAYLLRAPKQQIKSEPRWITHYLRLVSWCLKHKGKTITTSALFFGGGILLAAGLPGTFMPANDDRQTQVTLTLQPGSKLHDTVLLAEQAREIVQKNQHVEKVYTAIGASRSGDSEESGGVGTSVRSAVLTLSLTHRDARSGLHKQQIEQQLREALHSLPGARIKVGMGGSSENYVLVLAGEDSRILEQHALQVERELRTILGIGAVTSTASLVRPELIIKPDFSRAADLGVTSSAIADTLRVATVGDYDQDLPKLNLSERQVPIVVRLNDIAREDFETFKRLPVPGARGPVALENVATLEIGSGPAEIARFDRMRNINFEVELNNLPLGVVEQAVTELPSLQTLPPGISQTALGDAEMMDELATGFAVAMLTGVIFIYMVLVLLLKDFFQPITILTALVLSVPGAFLALYLTSSDLSLPAMIGLIMLMGIATKNSILLVDYITIARRDLHQNRWDAVIDACRKRVRPIVMTTIAMGAGMVPIALGMGGDPSFRAPMAIVVIGGLITSTFLSLLVIPVAYSYVDDVVQWLKPHLHRMPLFNR
ncbi:MULTISPECIES: efflux RND transporter permease subunit [Pectobacterium]|uniref:Efflux RND transporter permease subunit n=1 Tax=Pectobacterium aquaticum TaxID=2204145 RepID=A0AA93AQH0_9GAMM|nr:MULTISPECIES: efflux RND transporter permease subunit [Pectobacterium]MBA0173813.1 efflux RND transporter permease subunit [Pectobacterium versatile]RRO08652.1 efflux RND transporter permease subunit [Pectobacterium aquaticum]RRO25337.1 efflux RND transporter permease subunit [Pectobacterium aquaticum]